METAWGENSETSLARFIAIGWDMCKSESDDSLAIVVNQVEYIVQRISRDIEKWNEYSLYNCLPSG